MKRNSNPASSWPLAAGWGRLLLGLSLLLLAAGCSSSPANIGVGLPSVDASTGAFLVDTLTIRASTVLRDSVVTSTSNYLLVGRYQDPELGAISTTSYTTLNLGSAFLPDQSLVADSAVLVLVSDTYRYGDTTQTQTLVDVRELNSFLPLTSFGFAKPTLTPMTGRLANTGSLNYTQPIIQRRARRNLGSLRVRLTNGFRDRLMTSGKTGQLATQELLDRNYPGFALLPGASDAAALVRYSASSSDTGIILYYHDPTDAATVLSHSFGISNGRHFYQVAAPQLPARVLALNSLGQLDASNNNNRTYIEGLLGLQTKIEIPYLFNLRNFGQHFVITNANMTVEVPANTLSNSLSLSPPLTLTVSTTDQRNHQGNAFTSVTYNPEVTSRDGITQAGYTWSVISYCQNVLNNNIPNAGMLLNTSTPALPERVVLGGPNGTINKVKLRLYLISID